LGSGEVALAADASSTGQDSNKTWNQMGHGFDG
jgi:hypothetical protein